MDRRHSISFPLQPQDLRATTRLQQRIFDELDVETRVDARARADDEQARAQLVQASEAGTDLLQHDTLAQRRAREARCGHKLQSRPLGSMGRRGTAAGYNLSLQDVLERSNGSADEVREGLREIVRRRLKNPRRHRAAPPMLPPSVAPQQASQKTPKEPGDEV